MNLYIKSAIASVTSVIGGVAIVCTFEWFLIRGLPLVNDLPVILIGYGIPSIVIGLPVQALLQKMSWTNLVSNLAIAILIGFPVGVWLLGIVEDMEKQRAQHFLSRLRNAITSLSDWYSVDWVILPYLVSGGLIFWLIRRPDKDAAKPLP
jgi:hypothetical protein